MADEDAANGLGYDERGLGLMPDGPFSSGALRDSSDLAVDDISHAFLASAAAAWDLDGFPPDEPSDLSSTTAAGPSHQPGYESPPWQDPPFEPQLVNSSGTAGFAIPNFGPPTIFSAGHDPSEQANSTLPTLKPPAMHRRTMLTPALEEELRNIAMPPSQQYHSPNSVSSPESSKTAIGSSPDASTSSLKGSRKRKVSDDLDDDGGTDEPEKPVKKTAHNMIEKRYRTNINDKIAALRDSVPSLRIMCKSARGEDTTEDQEELHGLTPAHKLNKATVLSKATEYIRHLEKRNNRLLEENGVMQARLAAFEKLWLGGAMGSSISPVHQQLTPISYGQDSQQQPHLASPMQTPRDAGSMPASVMDSQGPMKRILSVQVPAGQPYPTAAAAQQPMIYTNPPMRTQDIQAQRQATGWTSTNPYLGKLMVSSLAGLMILEAVRESESTTEEPAGRGLFALPLQVLGHVPSSIPLRAMGFQSHLPLKFLLMLGVVLWAFAPSLFASLDMKPKKQHGGALQAPTSCAAPVATRRKAWLTSIETIWVPHHFVFLEVAALVVLALKLGIRKLFGDDAYRRLSGLSELEEAGRVKAWTIALDSQLSGGDEDICGTRLLYTLLASESLPETPARLMHKALHIRLLAWDPMERRQEGWLTALAGWLARTRWNKARRLNHVLVQDGDMTSKRHPNAAPGHLAALLEEECDEILNDRILQRAYNLAYNLETSHNDPGAIESMNSVLEDSSLTGPLDAVAAWWSTELLHDVLTAAVDKRVDGDVSDDEDDGDEDEDEDEDDAEKKDDQESLIDEETAAELRALGIEQALTIAPAGSIAQIRAILARAVLIEKTRGANIAAAVQNMAEHDKVKEKARAKEHAEEKGGPISGTTSSRPGSIGAAHSRDPELQLSMRCAVALAHLQRLRSGVSDSRASFCEAVDEISSLCRMSTMSLLTFVFVMKVMEEALEDQSLAESLASKLEGLAKHLRIWMGGPQGSRYGVGRALRERVVGRCVAAMRRLLHMDYDPGYSSMSEDEAPKGLPKPIPRVMRKMSSTRSATDDEM